MCSVLYVVFLSSLFSFWRLYLEADESAVIARPLISKGNCAIPAAVPHFLTHIHPVQQQPKNTTTQKFSLDHYTPRLSVVSIYLRGSQLPANGLKEKKGYQRKEERYILHPCVVHVYLPAAGKHLWPIFPHSTQKVGKIIIRRIIVKQVYIFRQFLISFLVCVMTWFLKKREKVEPAVICEPCGI